MSGQAGLSSWSALEVVEAMDRRTLTGGIRCPGCGTDISATKGGQPLPDGCNADRTFGWQCESCNNVVPCRAFGPEARTFNDRYRGLEVEFRDGHERFIPVPVEGDAPLASGDTDPINGGAE